ncbi:unnamed protein product [Candida parapsilosis]
MQESHEVLKQNIGGKISRVLNVHLRKYLEFLRIIKPISYNNPYVVSYDSYNTNLSSSSGSAGGYIGCGCAGGSRRLTSNFAYSRAIGNYIISLIEMLEIVIDYYSESESFSFQDADFMV